MYTVNHFQLLLFQYTQNSTNYAFYCAQTCLLCSNATHYSLGPGSWAWGWDTSLSETGTGKTDRN